MEKKNLAVGSTAERDVSSALVFLLEADVEWNASPALESWKSKVDNYGLLQLDIAWCYLLLGSLDGLEDAVRRLDVAERVLRQQVHANFVTLALAQAEMHNPIPPLCAVFVRLFLLQGVAHALRDDAAAAAERLGWARLLCRRLRSACPAEDVEALCDACLVAPCTAIAALRRSNGDPDAAAHQISSDRDRERRAARKRRRQRRWGKCANGAEYVDLDLAPTLAAYLGFGDVAGDLDGGGGEREGGGVDAPGEDASTSALIVVGLLRLSNNSVDRSLELYRSLGQHGVLEQARLLDRASGRRKRRGRSLSEVHEVQDIELTRLVSMGVEEARARKALRATGNFDGALLSLSTDDNPNECAKQNEKDECHLDDQALESTDGDANKRTKKRENQDCHLDDLATGSTDADVNKCAKKSENLDCNLADQALESDSSDDDISRENEIDDAHELLEKELSNALSVDSKQLLEKEWLGVDMQEEWELIQKYTLGNDAANAS